MSALTASISRAVETGLLPGRVWLYSNYHCNLDCGYCLTESAPGVAKRKLAPETMVRVAREARDLGFVSLGVTGGEPFLAPRMADTLVEMAEYLPLVALSNGTLFTGPRLDSLDVLAGADVELQISLDSADPDVNDKARAPENFAKVVEAIPHLVDKGINVRIATTVEDPDADTEDMARLRSLLRSLGVQDKDHLLRPIVHRGRAIDQQQGFDAAAGDLPKEVAITADGAFWSPFGPTVHDGVVDTDLLLTRTTDPLSVPAEALLRIAEGGAPRSDTAPAIRCAV